MLDLRATKGEIADLIKRRLGEPVVKVELTDQQIYDAIDYAKMKWVKWGAGNSIVETYFTTLLIAGQNFYDLPVGVVDIVDYEDYGYSRGVNTLFTVENYLFYNTGGGEAFWGGLAGGGKTTYGDTFLSYHLALDYLKTVDRYIHSEYNYKYHKYTNQLEVHPYPTSGNALQVTDNDTGETITVDSPGYILIRSYMVEGSHYAGMETDVTQSSWKRNWKNSSSDENFYTSDWIFDYAMAECKIMLGRIRSKFAQFTSIGNTGIALDGDQLIQEGITEKERLDETLRLEETHEGYGVIWG